MKCHAFDMWINGFTAGCQRLIANGLSIWTLKIKYGISETKYDCPSISNRERIFFFFLRFLLAEITRVSDYTLCKATYFPHTTAVHNNLLSTHNSCAKQLIVHTQQLCKTIYCPHTTAMQNKSLFANHSCAKQLIFYTPQLCTTTYCPHTTAVQNNLLSTHHSCVKQLIVQHHSCAKQLIFHSP